MSTDTLSLAIAPEGKTAYSLASLWKVISIIISLEPNKNTGKLAVSKKEAPSFLNGIPYVLHLAPSITILDALGFPVLDTSIFPLGAN